MSVSNFEKAREAMVVSQLQPNGVSEERVLDAYRSVKREDFLPEPLKGVCYLDENIDLGNGFTLLEPMLHGLLVEELDIEPSDKILDIGDVTGYSAAILAQLGGQVVTDVENPGSGFDVILLNGAVAVIPDHLVALLAPGGRLGTILQPEGKVGKIAIVTKEASGAIARRMLQDAKVPYLKGFEPVKQFVF